MSKKNVLFKSEEWKARHSTAEFLRELADGLEQGSVTLRRGEQEVDLIIPETVEVEIEVTEKVKRHKTEWELEIEIEWIDAENGGTVTLG